MASAGGSIRNEVWLRLCGRVCIEVDGHVVDDAPLGHLGRLALGFLAAERHRPVSRDELADAIWGESPPPTWPHALRGIVSRVRSVLASAGLAAPETLTSASGCYQLHLPAGAVVDVEEAGAALIEARTALHEGRPAAAVEQAQCALSLTAGRFLAGSSGEWIARRQRALGDLRLDALELLSGAATAAGELALAVEAAEEAIGLQPLRESAYLRLVDAHAAAGNRAEALRAYERCRRTLVEELGVDPSPTTEAAYLELLTDPEPDTSAERPAGRLPGSITSFVGRDQAIAEVRKAMRATRLLSLVGVGGVGKSRLALQVAGEASADYAEGVWLVELAGLGDPGLVASQTLAVLGGPEVRAEPATEALARHLAASRLLLVLDNCEHLIDACAEVVAHLLRRCPGLEVLTTSREPLGVPGETVWPVPPLTTPAPDQAGDPAALVGFEAVRLFVDRASAVAPDLPLDGRTLADVATVVHRLDGIPLAIELAAAWAKVLSVADIARRLDDRFRLLVGGPRTAPARHQTLRAALDWSYESLAPAEAAVLRRLSVFAGGFTLAAVEAVCRYGELDIDVLGTLSSLFDKSLVLVDRSRPSTRYRQLETVRQYAADRLVEGGEDAVARRDHLRWALSLAEAAAPELEGAGQAVWLDALDADHDNLRAALDWAAAGGDPELGGRLAAALWRYWEIRGWLSEGRGHLATWVSRDGLPPELRARLLNSAGILAQRQRDNVVARTYYEECLVVRHSLGEELGVASALHGLGNIAFIEGDMDLARSRFEENLALGRRLGIEAMVAASLLNLGVIDQALFMHRKLAKEVAETRGRTSMLEALDAYERLGDRNGMAMALENLGTFSGWLRDRDAAKRYQERSLVIRRELGDKPGIAISARYLSRLALQTGDCGTARDLSEECLAIERELGKPPDEAEALGFLAQVAMTERNFGEARSLLEEGIALHQRRTDDPVPPWLLNALGDVTIAQRDFGTARSTYEELVTRAREVEQPGLLAGALSKLCLVALAEGRTGDVLAGAAEALVVPKVGENIWVLSALGEALAGVLVVRADYGLAAQLLGASDGLRRDAGAMAAQPHLSPEHDDSMQSIRTALGDDAFSEAWACGGALTGEGLADLLAGVVGPVSPLPPPPN